MKIPFKSVVSVILLFAMLLGLVPALPGNVLEVSAVDNTYKHVVVVGIDGMGNFNQKCDTPNIDKLFKNNPKAAWTDYAMASNPNISAQCWTSMLTGVMPNVHGITNDIVENTGIKYNNATYPTLFKYIRQARPDAKMACYSSWIGPANGMVEEGLNVDTKYTSYNDAQLCADSVAYIKANKPDFFFCVFNDVDAAGHSKNWGSADYLNTLTKVDGYLGQVYQAVVDAGMLEDTLFICTTDHGGWTNGHGVRTTSTKYTFFGAIGKTINPNANLYVRGVDLAAIVGHAMGISGNSQWESVVPQYMFKDYMNPPFTKHPDTLTGGHNRNGASRVTPTSAVKDYIGNYVDMDKLGAALFFDGDVSDHVGLQTAQAKGNVVYETGYFGKGVNLENGYISLPDLKLGTESFTIGLWMKQKGDYADSQDPVIFCNKQWGPGMGATDGVIFTEWGNNPAFRVSRDGTNNQVRATYPAEAQTVVNYDTSGSAWVADGYDDLWVHTLLEVDRPNNKVRIYYNFVLSGEFSMENWVKDMSFDTEYPFNIGQDATGNYSVKLKTTLDDFLFFNGTLSQDEIDDLRKYYTPVSTGSAPTNASVWLEKKQFDANENVRFYSTSDGYSNTLWVYDPNGGSTYYQNVTSPYTLRFNVPGTYRALVQAWNGKGSFTSQEIQFTVGNPPADGSVVTSKDTYEVNERVYFTIYSTADKTDLHIERADGQWMNTIENVGDTYDVAFGWSGTYCAYIVTTNNMGVTAGPKTYFVVGSPTTATITFQDWDGTIIESKEYGYGETVTPPADPFLEGEIFIGWDRTIVPVEGDAVYIARYIPDGNPTYTVTFKNWDGSVISTKTYKYGNTITVPEDPTKAADENNTYAFTGWDKEVSATCIGNATYTAQFSATKIAYTVTFKNWDGSVISTKTYGYGDTVTVPANPTKVADNTNTYAFTGWDKSVATTCKGDATYIAQFSANKISYTVIFKNWDGSVISTKTYGYGDTVTVPANPTKAADSTNTYTFTGWDKSVATTCKGNATYTAQFSANKISYTVTFKNWDGSVILEETYHYGDTIDIPADPTKAADETNTYAFNGWDKEVSATCIGNATYTAQFSATKIAYTVTFKNWDGTVISEETYHYGDTITIPADPAKESDDTYTYAFIGWDSEVLETCQGDAVYTAEFTPSNISYTVIFKDHDGTVISEQTYYFGDDIQVPADPEREGFKFLGWDTEVSATCKGDATYIATYEEIEAEPDIVKGDVNQDGSCDIGDFVQIKAHMLGKVTLEADAAAAADLNGDGAVDIGDFVIYKAYLLGKGSLGL